jgi:acyl dehydratase
LTTHPPFAQPRRSSGERPRFEEDTMQQKPFDDFAVGEVFKSYGRTITDADLQAFTCFAGLKLPIFIDEEFAKSKTDYGGRIAPGFMTASIAAGMMEDILGPYTLAALGLGDFVFRVPVRPMDTIHCEIEVADKRDTKDGKRGVLKSLTRVINQRGETALEFSGTFLMRKERFD